MRREVKDKILQALTYIASALSVFVLGAIIVYLVINGLSLINTHLLTSNYYPQTANSGVKADYVYSEMGDYSGNGHYSKKWGIAVEDIVTSHNDEEISVTYIDPNSPFADATAAKQGIVVMLNTINATKPAIVAPVKVIICSTY